MRAWVTAAIAVLFLAILLLVLARQPKGAPNVSVAFPGEPWTLKFDSGDFVVEENGIQSDGRAYLRADNPKTKVTLSVYLEKVDGAATEMGCDDTQQQRLSEKLEFDRDAAVARKLAGMTIVEYTIPEFKGVQLRQRNLFICMPKDDVYVDVHLSKEFFNPPDEKLFTDVLDSAHFVEKPSPAGR